MQKLREYLRNHSVIMHAFTAREELLVNSKNMMAKKKIKLGRVIFGVFVILIHFNFASAQIFAPSDTLQLLDVYAFTGDSSVPVVVELKNSIPVAGFSVRLSYDPNFITPRTIYGDTGWAVVATHPTERSDGLGIFQGVVREPGVLTFIASVDWTPGYEYIAAGSGPVVEFEFVVNPGIPFDTVTHIIFENDPENPLSYNNFTDTLGMETYIPELADGMFHIKKRESQDTLMIVDGFGEGGEVMPVLVDLSNSVDVGGFSLRLSYDPDLLTPRTTYGTTSWVVVAHPTERSDGLGIFQGVIREPGVLTFIGAVDLAPGYEYIAAGSGPVVQFEFLVNSDIQQDTVTYIIFENDPEYPLSYNNFTDTLGERLYVPQIVNGSFSLKKGIPRDTLRVVDGFGEGGEVMPVLVDLSNSVDVGGFSLRLSYDPDLLTPRTTYGTTSWVVVAHPTGRSDGLGIFQGVIREPGVLTFIGAVDLAPEFEYIAAGSGPVVEFEFLVNSDIQQDTVTYIIFENDPEYPSSYNNFTDTLGVKTYFPELLDGVFHIGKRESQDTLMIVDGFGEGGEVMPVLVDLSNSVDVGGFSLRLSYDPDLLTPRTTNGTTSWVAVAHPTGRSDGLGIFQGVIREPGVLTFIGAVDLAPGYEYIAAGSGPVVEFEFFSEF